MIYLGIDSGTQSTKTIALDLESGAIVASAAEAYGMIDGLPTGHLEQDPQVWIDAVDKTIRSCIAQLGSRKNEVRGIGVSGQQHGLVVLDQDDQVIRPAKLWCDTSTVNECTEITSQFGGADGLVKLAGLPMLPGYTAPKILWLKKHEPQNYKKLRKILLPHDYINFWLTGQKRMEFGDASGTALLDIRKRVWSKEICDFIDPQLMTWLPEVQTSRKPIGMVRPELCKTWGLAASPVVSAGGGDNMMGAIGTGNIREGVVTASIGTSGTIYATSYKPVIDPRGEVAAFCDSNDQWLPLCCTMNVTVLTEQVRKTFGWSIEQFNQAAQEAQPGAGGLIFLPYLNGERTPNLPDSVGTLHGLTSKNMIPSNIARASIEGATMGLAYGLDRLRALGIEPKEIRLTGGGSKSPLWREIAADIFGVEIVCLNTSENAALGAAIQAAQESESLQSCIDRVVGTDDSTRVRPTEDQRTVYADSVNRFNALTRQLYQ